MRTRAAALVLLAALAAGCGDYLEGPGSGGFHACARNNGGGSEAAQWCADFDEASW